MIRSLFGSGHYTPARCVEDRPAHRVFISRYGAHIKTRRQKHPQIRTPGIAAPH